MTDVPGQHDPALRAFGAQVDEYAAGLEGLLGTYRLYSTHPDIDPDRDLGSIQGRLLEISAAIGETIGHKAVTDVAGTTQAEPATVYLFGKHTMIAGEKVFPLHIQEREILTALWDAEEPLSTEDLHMQSAATYKHIQTTGTRTRKLSTTIRGALGKESEPIKCSIRYGRGPSTPQNYYAVDRTSIRIEEIPPTPDLHVRFTEADMYSKLIDPERLTKPVLKTDKPLTILERVDNRLLRIADGGREIRLVTDNLVYCVNSLLVSEGYALPDELMSFGFREASLAQAKHSFAQYFDAVENRLNGPNHQYDILITDGLRSPLRSLGLHVRYVRTQRRPSVTLQASGQSSGTNAATTESATIPESIDQDGTDPMEAQIQVTAETVRRPVSVTLRDKQDIIVNGMSLERTKRLPNAVMYVLLHTNGDLVNAETVRQLMGLSTTQDTSKTRIALRTVQGLAAKTNDMLGFEFITMQGDELTDEVRFGISEECDVSLDSDIEAPSIGTLPPILRTDSTLEGSLYDGILLDTRTPELKPATDDPIDLRVLTNNHIYVSDGRVGHVVTLRGHKLAIFNILQALGEVSRADAIKELFSRLKIEDERLPNNISDLLYELATDFGQNNGEDIIFRGKTGRNALYGTNYRSRIVDERRIVSSAIHLDVSGRLALRLAMGGKRRSQPADATRRAEEVGAGDRSLFVDYGAIILAANEAGEEESITPLARELAAVEDTGYSMEEVVDALFLQRLSQETGVSFEPTRDMTISLAQHMESVYARLDRALHTMRVTNPSTRISEDKIVALLLGIPPEVPFVGDLQIIIPSSKPQPYPDMYNTLRREGRNTRQLNHYLKSDPASIDTIYKRALADLAQRLAVPD